MFASNVRHLEWEYRSIDIDSIDSDNIACSSLGGGDILEDYGRLWKTHKNVSPRKLRQDCQHLANYDLAEN